MDDIYRQLSAEIAKTKTASTGLVDFQTVSMDSYLGAGFEDRAAIVHGTGDQLATLKEGMVELLALLRAQYWLYQHCHWQVEGSGFYGDHLLFQRLSENVEAEIDQLAEKIVGYLGPSTLCPSDLMDRSKRWIDSWRRVDGHHARALVAERDFTGYAKGFYDTISRLGVMTLGLDDFVMSICGAHDSHVYLLQQRQLDSNHRQSSTKQSTEIRKVADLSDLRDFVRVGNALVHKSDKDFWELTKDADGNHVIKRLVDTDVLSY